MSIIYSALDPATIVFSNLDKTRKGGKIVYLSLGNDRKNRIVIQTPNMSLPFGVTPYTEASTGEIQSYSIDLSFRGHDTDPKIAEFLSKMRHIDDIIVSEGVKQSKEYFGKQMARDLVVEFYRKLIKDPSNQQYAPTMRCKVPVYNGEPTSLFFDENRQPTTIDSITKGCSVRMILEMSSLWFVNKNFGATWKVVQCLITDKPKRMDTFAFVDDGTNKSEEEDTTIDDEDDV
jgi:hypothetical protein